jgi:hypothetical protein
MKHMTPFEPSSLTLLAGTWQQSTAEIIEGAPDERSHRLELRTLVLVNLQEVLQILCTTNHAKVIIIGVGLVIIKKLI